ncbi:MAG: adenosylcobinamide amidohydrolase [Deltaproteobacteria bacterium]|nr:adenosylcobinamide amidohydrolase [Deltaproteobacteria bacterium]
MLLNRYYDGVEIHREDKIIYARFLSPHRVISTCPAAGGVREDIEVLYNHQSCEPTKHQTMGDRIIKILPTQYRQEVATRHDLPADRCATLGTAANMRCAGFSSRAFRELEVVAVCTGGVETNGGRVGDPASVYESDGRFERLREAPPTQGTINTMLFINRELTQGALVRCIVTATEAKTAALQQLSVPSRYSTGLATGTGTDQIGVACRLGDIHPLRSAGKHSKLGELIGVTVQEAIEETLSRQNGLTPSSRCSVIAHLERFGATQKDAVAQINALLSDEDAQLLKNNFESMNHDPLVVAAVVALVHLRDQITWGTIPQSCLPDLLYTMTAQIAASVSGRYDQFDQYRRLLYEKEPHLNGNDLTHIIYIALASGFADKWRFE